MIKDKNNNIISNITNDDVTVAGTDLFADSEDFLNELTDSDLGQIVGGNDVVTEVEHVVNDFLPSHASLLLC